MNRDRPFSYLKKSEMKGKEVFTFYARIDEPIPLTSIHDWVDRFDLQDEYQEFVSAIFAMDDEYMTIKNDHDGSKKRKPPSKQKMTRALFGALFKRG